MAYELTFTRGFKDGLAGLPREIYPIIDRQLAWIARDPFSRNPNATRMKNVRHSFRVKIGSHVRMLYQVHAKRMRIELNGIGTREHIYARSVSGTKQLTADEMKEILSEIQGTPRLPNLESADGMRTVPVRLATDSPLELPVTVEYAEWITEDDLFLLQVPVGIWPVVLAAKSVSALQNCDVDEAIKDQIEDYWTSPEPSQIEKLYAISSGQGADDIAQRSLSHFLIALDPDQKQALQRFKGDGPYLLKGSAGTGKSLVGLYHIRDLITARAGESLFDKSAALFGVITYTNTLVDANRTLLQAITPASAHPGIRCTTLDKIAYDLSEKALGTRPNALDVDGIANWISNVVLGSAPDHQDFVTQLGVNYVADEIEQVIIGNGLDSLEEYLAQERRGRKRGLRENERTAIWAVYQAFERLCEKRKVQTFEQWRKIALKHLAKEPNYPRFSVLFVDEAQDFSKVARQLCLALVADPKNLLLAADTGQSIYTVPSSWIKTDPRLNFQRRKPIMLERSYRATCEISQAIAPLRADPGDEDDRSSNARPVFSGSKPRWIQAPLGDHAAIVCKEIYTLISDKLHPINPGQIAVIVRDAKAADLFKSRLASDGIDSAIVDKRSPLNVDTGHVHIVTAHSSKGLGFPIVFVPELGDLVYPSRVMLSRAKNSDPQQQEQIEESEQRLLYVALSRASHRLFMIVDESNPSRFLRKLDRSAHWC